MTNDQNDFFMYTTSDFGESMSDDDNEETVVLGKRANLKETSQKIPKIPTKQAKNHSVYSGQEKFLYHPEIDFSNLSQYTNSSIEVKVEACYVNFDNPNVIKSKLYGTDHYTSTSDFVAIFLHSKFYNPEELKKKTFAGISLIFSVTKQKRNYLSSDRNGIVSKKLSLNTSFNFQNIKLEQYKLIQSWKLEEVNKMAEKASIADKKRTKIVPERKDSKLQPRFNNLVFNMNNELAIEYNIINICEKSNDSNDYLSNILKKYYMVIETGKMMKFVITGVQKDSLKYFPNEFHYKVLQIKNPAEFDNEYFNRNKIPIKKCNEIIKGIPWEDIVWSDASIKFKGTNFEILQPISFKFYKITDAN